MLVITRFTLRLVFDDLFVHGRRRWWLRRARRLRSDIAHGLDVLDFLSDAEPAQDVSEAVTKSEGTGTHCQHALRILLPRACLAPERGFFRIGDREASADRI